MKTAARSIPLLTALMLGCQAGALTSGAVGGPGGGHADDAGVDAPGAPDDAADPGDRSPADEVTASPDELAPPRPTGEVPGGGMPPVAGDAPPAADTPPEPAPEPEPAADTPPEPAADTPPEPAPEPAADARYRRRLPDTRDRVHVFYDQLHNHLTEAQYAFAATHADGSQKLTRSVSDRIRAVNPQFVVLQYRLAFGLSADENITAENLWDRDTIEPDDAAHAGDPRQTREDFYLHVPAGSDQRVRHADNYWLADVRNPDWQRYQIDELARRLDTNDFDGAFLDTAHVRWDGLTPDAWWEDFCGPEYHALPGCWNPPTRPYFEALVARFRAGPSWHYVVGNMGPLVAEADDNGPLAALDGGMVEHFMYLGDLPGERDWHITAERITRLIGDTKILIAEPVHFDPADRRVRRWLIANFRFFQGRQSFAAFYPQGTGHVDAPVWLPEYDLDLGAPLEPVPAQAGALCTGEAAAFACSGLYVRDFEQGFVALNPAREPRHVDLPAPGAGLRYATVDFQGGGYVDEAGQKAPQALVLTPFEGTGLDVPAQDARLIIRVDAQGAQARSAD